MINTLGYYCLAITVLVAAFELLVSLAAVRFGSSQVRRTARRGLYLMAGLLTVSSACLMHAFVTSDFSLSYVARYTERALPLGYKLAAFWAGQEGSLLLWAWLLGVMAALFAFLQRRDQTVENDAAQGTLAAVTGFFAALMLFAANPFEPAVQIAGDGMGLNPMLQDPWMISHPPTLFIGYAGFTVPFALAVGALIARRTDEKWTSLARPWVMFSWLFLGIGILLGAKWAYVELGWGGYWAWDPVENASLLPWLTGTALLHSLVGQRGQGMFKRWNLALAIATFLLCIFGTYITRSGVVASVHTFGKSLVGTFFAVFLLIGVLTSLALFFWRFGAFKADRPLDGLLNREGMLLAGNVLLVLMTAITLVLTMWPAFSGTIDGKEATVPPRVFNKMVLPFALLLVAIMATGPLLSSVGQDAIRKLLRGLTIPLATAIVVCGGLWAMEIRSVWALAAAAAATAVVSAILADLCLCVWTRHGQSGENLLVAAVRVIDGNHRRYGAHIVHAGIALIVIGVAGSSIYGTESKVSLKPGESVDVNRYTLTLHSIDSRRAENYGAAIARVTMLDRASGAIRELQPQHRTYDKGGQTMSEVAIRSNWREDLYVTVLGADDDGSVAFRVIVSPLVSWIWTGGLVLTVGAVFGLLPRFLPLRAVAPAAEPAQPTKPVRIAMAR